MVTKICPICNKEFQVIPCRENTAKYCSINCRQESLKGELNCVCEYCGKKFHRKNYRKNKNKHNTCSKECCNKLKALLYSGENNHQFGLKGELNSSFKGEKIIRRNNNLLDILVYMPDHPRSDKSGRVAEHRLLVEQNYKLFNNKYFENINDRIVLKKSSQVHHINFDHTDNRIENLMPVTKSEHTAIHNLFSSIIRDPNTGKITGVIKQGELLEKPEEVDQQPSLSGDTFEGSETNSRVLRDSNADTSALPQ
jgi:hypothetical protein